MAGAALAAAGAGAALAAAPPVRPAQSPVRAEAFERASDTRLRTSRISQCVRVRRPSRTPALALDGRVLPFDPSTGKEPGTRPRCRAAARTSCACRPCASAASARTSAAAAVACRAARRSSRGRAAEHHSHLLWNLPRDRRGLLPGAGSCSRASRCGWPRGRRIGRSTHAERPAHRPDARDRCHRRGAPDGEPGMLNCHPWASRNARRRRFTYDMQFWHPSARTAHGWHTSMCPRTRLDGKSHGEHGPQRSEPDRRARGRAAPRDVFGMSVAAIARRVGGDRSARRPALSRRLGPARAPSPGARTRRGA